MDADLLGGIAVAGGLGMAVAMLLISVSHDRASVRQQLRLFSVALAIRFALSVAIYQGGLLSVIGDEDASGWGGGVAIANRWHAQGVSLFELPFVLTEAFEVHHTGYKYLIGALFYVTGLPFRMPAAALNCVFGALTVVFAYRTARLLFSDAVATRAAWLACVFPSMVIWSAMTVKEPVVIFLETLALYGCVQLRQLRVSLPHLTLCAATIVLLIPFRFYAAYLVAVAVLVALLAPALVRPLSGVAGVLLALLLVTLIGATGAFARNEAQFEAFDADRIQSFRTAVASGSSGTGSGVESDYDMHTPSGMAMGTVVGAAHLLLAPFPWQLGGASMRLLLTLPELVYWWWLFAVGVIPGVWLAIRHRLADVAPMLLLILGLGLLYSMMFGNIGLVFRQRAQLLPWLLIFAAVGLEHRAAQQRSRVTEQTTHAAPYPA